jgi:hypothetical protein
MHGTKTNTSNTYNARGFITTTQYNQTDSITSVHVSVYVFLQCERFRNSLSSSHNGIYEIPLFKKKTTWCV